MAGPRRLILFLVALPWWLLAGGAFGEPVSPQAPVPAVATTESPSPLVLRAHPTASQAVPQPENDTEPPPAPVTDEAWAAAKAAFEHALEYVDQPRARALAEWMIRVRPQDAEGYAGLGRFAVQQERWGDARRWLRQALRRDADHVYALASMARVLEHDRAYTAALAVARRAERLDPREFRVHARLSRIQFKRGNLEASVRHAWRVLDLEPDRATGHIIVGSGFVSIEHPVDRRALRRQGDPVARLAYETARDAFAKGDLAQAGELAELARRADARFFGGPFVQGLIERREGDLAEAIAALELAARRGRGYPLLHNALGTALAEQHVARHAASQWPELQAFFDARPAPEVPGIERVIEGFEALSPDLQAAVARAVGPWGHLLEALAEQQVTHELLPMSHSAVESPRRSWLAGRRAFDGRLYDDVRGMGGQHAVTGLENVTQEANALFNTLAHEVAHQIHRYALPAVDQARIHALYESAIAQGRTLDYYAAMNEYEYFAQGYEAFVSLFKRPCCGDTGRHTRFELQARDPDLMAFIAARVLPDWFAGEEWDAAIAAAADCLEHAGRSAEATRARAWYAERRADRSGSGSDE